MESEFWAAIAGAVVGGLMSAGVQVVTMSWQAKERHNQGAYSLFYKLHSMANDLHHFGAHLNEAKATADKKGTLLWQCLFPISNLPSNREIDSSELVLIHKAGEFELLNEIRNLELIHTGMISSMSAYAVKRSSLGERMPARMKGSEGLTELSQEQMDALGPSMAELDTLADGMWEMFASQSEAAMATLVKMNDALTKLVGKSFKLELAKTGEAIK